VCKKSWLLYIGRLDGRLVLAFTTSLQSKYALRHLLLGSFPSNLVLFGFSYNSDFDGKDFLRRQARHLGISNGYSKIYIYFEGSDHQFDTLTRDIILLHHPRDLPNITQHIPLVHHLATPRHYTYLHNDLHKHPLPRPGPCACDSVRCSYSGRQLDIQPDPKARLAQGGY
jgi:hypothetical protein